MRVFAYLSMARCLALLISKPGWLVMLVIVWPMLLEIVGIFVHTPRTTIASRALYC